MTMLVRSLLLFLSFAAPPINGSNRHVAHLPSLCFAGGFGVSNTKKKVPLSNKAKKLLKKHKNNVDAASSDYFQSQMVELVDDSKSKDEQHEDRVAATWNTVAMFLPQNYASTKGKVEPYVERRLGHIVTACRGDEALQLLDVGCGDGALVPYLGQECDFSGLDVSSEMIELGQKRWPKHKLWVGSFPKASPTTRSTTLYSSMDRSNSFGIRVRLWLMPRLG